MFGRSHMHDDVSKEYFHRHPVDVFKHAWNLITADNDAEQEGGIDTEKKKPG